MKYKKWLWLIASVVILIICITEFVERNSLNKSNVNVYVSEVEIESESESGTLAETTSDVNESFFLPVQIIYQYPDMPSGCEITSLAMVLNYLGFEVTNFYLADNFLPNDTYDMNKSFVGSVYTDSSFGCFAPVITKSANDYFSSIGSSATAVNVSGSSREQLLSYVKSGVPIVIWNTEDMRETYIEHYDFDGTDFVWYGYEHCVVLCGYNADDNTVAIADSIAGLVYRDADTFFRIYKDLQSQAVYIKL